MKRNYFLRKFLFYFLVVFLPVALFSIAYSAYSSYKIRQSINDDAENKYTRGIQYVSLVLDVFPGEGSIFDASSVLTRVIKKVIESDFLSYSDSVNSKILTAIINNYANTRDTIDSIYLYAENEYGNYIRSGYGRSSLEGKVHREWLDILRETDASVKVWISSYESRYYAFEEPHTIVSVFYRLNSLDGAIVVNMNEIALMRMLDTLATYRGEMIFVTDMDGRYLFGNSASSGLLQYREDMDAIFAEKKPTTENLFNVLVDGEQYVMLEVFNKTFGIRFYSLTAADVLYHMPRQMMRLLLFAACFAAVASLFLSYLITQKSFSQIKNVVSVINAAENGMYEPQKPSARQDEYDIILNNVLDVFIRNSYLNLQVNQLELEKQLAEFRALQLQINPHFLFNTLQSISMKAMRVHTDDSLTSTVENLSEILRYSLELSQPKVTLQQEIAISKKFLAIEMERFPHRFYVVWDYDKSMLQHCILRLILQPILENSLRHGILPSDKAGLMKIRVETSRKFLHITITDNGIGMTEAELHALARQVREKFSRNDKHVGLKNVRMRLKLLYGDNAEMHIFSILGMGTSISLNVPLDTIVPDEAASVQRYAVEQPDADNQT